MTTDDDFDGTRWAMLFARWILGLQFLMAGYFKVFDMGAINHARNLFVVAYETSWMPQPLLWALGTSLPFVELLIGGLLCVGVLRKQSLIAVGVILVIVTYGHLLKQPFYVVTNQILPRLAILAFLFVVSLRKDVFSVDHVLAGWRRSSRGRG